MGKCLFISDCLQEDVKIKLVKVADKFIFLITKKYKVYNNLI